MGSGQGCGLTFHSTRGSPTTQNGLAPAVTMLRLTVLEVKGGAVEAASSSPWGTRFSLTQRRSHPRGDSG